MKNLPKSKSKLFILFRYYLTGILVAIFTFFAIRGALGFVLVGAGNVTRGRGEPSQGEETASRFGDQPKQGEVLPFFGERKVLETTETQEFPGSISVKGGTIFVYDSGGTDYMAFRHDGTDANLDFTNTTDLNIGKNLSITGYVDVSAGSQPTGAAGRIYYDSSGNKMYYYNGGAWKDMTGGEGAWTDGGSYLYPTSRETVFVYDSGGTDYIAFRHDGTDANLDFSGTTDLNLNGVNLEKPSSSLSLNIAGASADFVVQTLGTDKLTVQSDGDVIVNSGNVGIGTTGPSEKLSIEGTLPNILLKSPSASTGNVKLTLDTSMDNRPARVIFAQNGTTRWAQGVLYRADDASNNKFSIATADTFESSKFVIDTTGNVGIGTGGPGDLLDINTTSTTTGIELDNRDALTGYDGDTWLRLNQSSEFTSGVYTPTHFRADGEIRQGSADAGGYEIQTGDQMYVGDYIVAMGGVHIGGTADPGTSNLTVDGKACAAYFHGDGSNLTNITGTIPAGMIAMFDTACPSGWAEVTAFQNRFPIGYGGDAVYCETGGNLCMSWFCYSACSCNRTISDPYTVPIDGYCGDVYCCSCSTTACGYGWRICTNLYCYTAVAVGTGCTRVICNSTAWQMTYQNTLPPFREVVFCKKS